MKLNVNQAGNVEISEFYTPIILKSKNSDLIIQLRDNEFEFLAGSNKSYIIGAGKLLELINNYFASKPDYFTESVEENKVYDYYHGQGIPEPNFVSPEGIAGTPGPGPHPTGLTQDEYLKKQIDELTKNSTLNELFNIDDEKAVYPYFRPGDENNPLLRNLPKEQSDKEERIRLSNNAIDEHKGTINLSKEIPLKKEYWFGQQAGEPNMDYLCQISLSTTDATEYNKKIDNDYQKVLDYTLTTVCKNLPAEIVTKTNKYRQTMTFDYGSEQLTVHVKYIDMDDNSNPCYHSGNIAVHAYHLDKIVTLQQVLKIQTDIKQKQTIDELNQRPTTDQLHEKKYFSSKFKALDPFDGAFKGFDHDKWLENKYDELLKPERKDRMTHKKDVDTLIDKVNLLTHNKPYLLKMVKQITPLVLPNEFSINKGIVKLNIETIDYDFYYHIQIQYLNVKNRFNVKPEYTFNFKVLNDTVESNRAIVDRYMLFLDNVLKQMSYM